MERRAPWPWWVALASSVALHALLVVYLSRAPPRAPPSPPAPIAFEVIELAPHAEQEVEAKPVPRPPRAAPRGERRSRAPLTSEPAEAPVPPPSAPLASDAPRAPPPISLLPSLAPGAMAVSPELGLEAEAPPTGLRAPKVSEDLVGDLVRETVGRGKVERGLVHPYYSSLGKALVRSWDADRAVSRKGLKGFGEQLVENSKVWNRLWQERAAAFGASGSPLEEGTGNEGANRWMATNERAPLGAPDLAARQALRKQMREEFKSTRRATLRVVQDRSGRLLSVELVSPSNDPGVDREALVDIRAAAERLPPPPEEALSGRDRLASLWQFELVISINPPVPTFSFEFDEALGFIDPRLPLDRRIYKRVRLLAVE